MKSLILHIQRLLANITAGILSATLFVAIGLKGVLLVFAFFAHRPLPFTIEGTIALMVFSTTMGMAAGILFFATAKHIPGSPSAKGGTFGLALFVALIPMLPTDFQREAMTLQEYIPFAITLFGLLLMGFGITLEFIARKLSLVQSSESLSDNFRGRGKIQPIYQRITRIL